MCLIICMFAIKLKALYCGSYIWRAVLEMSVLNDDRYSGSVLPVLELENHYIKKHRCIIINNCKSQWSIVPVIAGSMVHDLSDAFWLEDEGE